MNINEMSHSSPPTSSLIMHDLQKLCTCAADILARSSIASQWPSLMHRSKHHCAVFSFTAFLSRKFCAHTKQYR